jgi:hypothetical protein
MKQYVTSQPVLVAPDPGETLFLYLAATTEVISMVLVAERSEHLSHPFFKDKTECITICMPVSSSIHIVTSSVNNQQ